MFFFVTIYYISEGLRDINPFGVLHVASENPIFPQFAVVTIRPAHVRAMMSSVEESTIPGTLEEGKPNLMGRGSNDQFPKSHPELKE